MEVDLPFLLCFTLSLRVLFQVQAPGGLILNILEGRFNVGFFCITGLGGLIHEGAYFRNFMVFFVSFFCGVKVTLMVYCLNGFKSVII